MGANFDVTKMEQLLAIFLRIMECLQQMQPDTRARLFRVIANLAKEPTLADDLEQLFSE